MSSKTKKSKDEPDLDPYEVLGIEPGVSDAAISKAYKKLALKLHPDKQQNLSSKEAERIAKEFHDVKEARAFLLEPEYREARLKYDAKRASIQQRRQADAQRQKSMNQKRRDMQDELKRREEEELHRKGKSSHKKFKKSKTAYDEELMKKLSKEGAEMRQAYAEKQAESAATFERNQAKRDINDRKERKRLLQDRQVRLKWSRKKMATSPSEHSLAVLLSRFGSVEEVEMIGSDGNLALITFASPSSCRTCVEAYKNSEEMRASYVGKRKEEEEVRKAAEEQEEELAPSRSKSSRDDESLHDRKLRQDAEREKLLRQLEAEDGESHGPSASGKVPAPTGQDSVQFSSRCVSVQFPSTEEYRHLSPIEKLQKAEQDILGILLPPETLSRLRELQS